MSVDPTPYIAPPGPAQALQRPRPDQLLDHRIGPPHGQPVAVLLTLPEYEHYLDLLEDEADSQDEDLAERLEQAAAHPTGGERESFRAYLAQRDTPRDEEITSVCT